MTPDVPMLRYMVLSALIGFFVFCASYSILVWKKRRQPSEGVRPSSHLRGWSVMCLVLGVLGVGITFAVRENVRADGMLGGDGLYAVRAAQGMRVVQLAEEGPVKAGETLAKFSSPKVQEEIEEARFQRDLLEKEKEILSLQPLALDPKLVRLLNDASAERRQLYNILSQALPTREGASRDATHTIITQRDLLAKLDNEMKVAQGEMRQAMAKRTVGLQQLKRERELAQRTNLSVNDLNEREKEVFSLDAEIAKHESRINASQAQFRQAKESLDKLEKNFLEQGGKLNEDLESTRKELVTAKSDCDKLEQLLVTDAKRAQASRDRELEKLEYKIKQADSQLVTIQNKLEEKAPYNGQVLYRHSSPGAALNFGPVLVFSHEGPRFRFRLAEDQVEALRNAGTVIVELEETSNSVEQRFPGHFLQSSALTREPGMAIVDLDCQAPPETVASLAEAKPIKARFSWRPPLMNLWSFPASLVAIGVGIFGLIASSFGGRQPALPRVRKNPAVPVIDDEDSILMHARPPAKEGDTIEARDTIPERPLLPNIPRERPFEPWEHPVGVRLREAIIREDVSAELIDAVESAIERKQDAVIVPLREALRRAPTVPDHARRLLDQLHSDRGDEMQQLEQHHLAQRLTFLLYTIGLEIPSHAQAVGRLDLVSRSY